MNLTFDDARLDLNGGTWLCLKVREPAPAKRFVLERRKRLYDLEVKEDREKRSLDANAYAWVLMDKLAAAIDSTKEEIYREKVRQFGPYRDFTMTESEAKTFCTAWGKLGVAWPTEQVDYAPDGERVVIRAYYGSSTYNTKQMSRLIDSIVDDCKAVGVETLTPDKLALLKEGWSRASND